jgi:hypothetical protein
MLRGACWLVAGAVVLLAQSAWAVSFSSSLKNFYTQFEVVKQCHERAQLSATDAELAKAAIAKIETHYLARDARINKDALLKAAVANKNEGFRIATRGSKVDLRQYCRATLKELLDKAEEIEAAQR